MNGTTEYFQITSKGVLVVARCNNPTQNYHAAGLFPSALWSSQFRFYSQQFLLL